MRLAFPTILLTALLLAPAAQASGTQSARVDGDRGKAEPLNSFVTVAATAGSLVLTTRQEWPSSPAVYEWKVTLGLTESLAQLPDGGVAIVAPWPPDILGPGDGTDYTGTQGTPGEADRTMPPLPASDPYRYSADPDGSMAADEAMHDVGPFDPRYSDEYMPDTGTDDPTDPDSPAKANRGPVPGRDRSDPVGPSDNAYVQESDPLDAIYDAEASRSDQIVGLIAAPQASDALGRHVVMQLKVKGPSSVELRFTPLFGAAFPLTATSSVTFNPDAYTAR